MALGPAYGSSGSGIPATGLTLADLADPGGMPVVRRGAGFGGGHVNVSWSMSTQSVGFRFKACRRGGTGGHIVGAFVGFAPNVYVSASSSALRIRNGGIHIAVIDNALPEGVSRSFEVFIGQTGGTVRIDGQLVASPSWATITWNTLAATYAIGAYHTGGAKFNGDIWDVELIDPASATNSAFFPLDGRNSSGEYPNTLAGSTVADATVTGTVLPVAINSGNAGSGVPIPVGPVVVSVVRTTVASHSGASGAKDFPSFTSAVLDPYGWYSGGGITPTVSGVAVWTLTGRIRATALSGSDDVTVAIDATPNVAVQGLTLDTVGEWIPFALTAARADDTEGVWHSFSVDGVATTTDIEVDDVTLTLTLYPDLS